VFTFFIFESPDSLKINNDIIFSLDSVKKTYDTSDKRPRNAYGDLLNDDPKYNRKYSIGLVLARVTSSNVFGWAYSRYVMNEDWAKVSIQSWKNNFKHGLEWDNDGFATNFCSSPCRQRLFQCCRSNGYSFGDRSFSFLKCKWEWFGENRRPQKRSAHYSDQWRFLVKYFIE
jgi:hypothetical protein